MDEMERVVRLTEPPAVWVTDAQRKILETPGAFAPFERPECETCWDRNAACPDCAKVSEDEHER